MKKLYVGSLPYDFTDDDLRELFEAYGKVDSASIILDRDTRRSKGFGFVEMSDAEEAKEAINKLHDTKVKGRTIIVSEAREREREREGGGGGFQKRRGPGGGGGANSNRRRY